MSVMKKLQQILLVGIFLYQILQTPPIFAESPEQTWEKDYGISIKWVEPEKDYRTVRFSGVPENGYAVIYATERATSFERPISVYVNGVDLYDDTAPVIIQDRVMAPMRKNFETLGCDISWHPETNTVTAVKDDTVIKLGIGQHTAFVIGEVVELDSPAILRDNRTLVPIRFIADALGMDVNWDENMRKVNVSA